MKTFNTHNWRFRVHHIDTIARSIYTTSSKANLSK